MRIGGMRHAVVFTTDSDASIRLSRRADVGEVAGGEAISQGEFHGEDMVKARIRWDAETAAIRHGWEMQWRGHAYNIESCVDARGRQRELMVMATKRS